MSTFDTSIIGTTSIETESNTSWVVDIVKGPLILILMGIIVLCILVLTIAVIHKLWKRKQPQKELNDEKKTDIAVIKMSSLSKSVSASQSQININM